MIRILPEQGHTLRVETDLDDDAELLISMGEGTESYFSAEALTELRDHLNKVLGE